MNMKIDSSIKREILFLGWNQKKKTVEAAVHVTNTIINICKNSQKGDRCSGIVVLKILKTDKVTCTSKWLFLLQVCDVY